MHLTAGYDWQIQDRLSLSNDVIWPDDQAGRLYGTADNTCSSITVIEKSKLCPGIQPRHYT